MNNRYNFGRRPYDLENKTQSLVLESKNISLGPDNGLMEQLNQRIPKGWYGNEEMMIELQCTPESLRGHIVNSHLHEHVISYYGIPRYDLEVAYYREIPLDWVIKKAYGKLEKDDPDIEHQLLNDARIAIRLLNNIGVQEYRKRVVKTLMFIEKLGLNQRPINWERIEESFLDSFSVELDPDLDSNDGIFLKVAEY